MTPRRAVGLMLAGLALMVAACTPNATPPAAAGTALPAGAIRRARDFYLVPLGRDAQGCLAYRTYSRHHLVAQVIYYADGQGGFVMDKTQADCHPAERR